MTRHRPTWTIVYWVAVAVVMLAALAVARLLVPPLIESAYHGRSWEVFNQLITGQDETPLAEYLATWRRLADRLLVGLGILAVGGYLGVTFRQRIREWVRSLTLEPDPGRVRPSAYVFVGLTVGLAAGMLEAAAVWGRVVLELEPPREYTAEVVWMAPVALALVFGALGAGSALVVRRWPAFPRFSFAVLLFAGVASYGLVRAVAPGVHPAAAMILALGVGSVVRRATMGSFPAVRFRRWSAVLAGVVVGAALIFHGGAWWLERRTTAALPAARNGLPNVLLLILDTVRAESLGLYGRERPTTPHLDALADDAVVFDWAFAPSSWTLPSHGTMFTGRWPAELSTGWRSPLDDTYPTLAEFLGRQGYATGGFVANYYYLTAFQGLNRGFQRYRDQPVSWRTLLWNTWLTRSLVMQVRGDLGRQWQFTRKTAHAVNAEFLSWLTSVGDRPYFAFLNYIDAHDPYRPPAPFDVRFGGADDRYWLGATDEEYTDEEVAQLRDAYEGGIAYVDLAVGSLLQDLAARGDLDNTILVITSDHGEEFGEHGFIGHGYSLYTPSLQVPLIVRLPGGAAGGTRIEPPVTLRDLPATFVDLLGRSGDSPFEGVSLAGLWSGGHDALTSPVLADLEQRPFELDERYPTRDGALRSIVEGDFHLIVRSDGKEELYDLASDPAERRDLRVDRPEVADRLREALDVSTRAGRPDSGSVTARF